MKRHEANGNSGWGPTQTLTKGKSPNPNVSPGISWLSEVELRVKTEGKAAELAAEREATGAEALKITKSAAPWYQRFLPEVVIQRFFH